MTKYRDFRQRAGTPVEFTPRRDRTVPTKNVIACPECGAPIGERCRTAAGHPMASNCHAARRRMAIRRLNQEKDTD